MNGRQPQGGGLWNSAKPVISAQTQNLLKTMMQESKLTSFQQRTLKNSITRAESLPTRVAPTFTIVEKKSPPTKPVRKTVDPNSYSNGLRNLDEIVASGAYDKSDFRPTMKTSITEKDKDRLARIMAFGKEAEEARLRKQYTNTDADEETAQEEPEIDRFDELKREIEERSQFLESMTKVGKRKQYEAIINTEISQKIREMELIDKTRTRELDELKKRKQQA